jgi:hypothetical protein
MQEENAERISVEDLTDLDLALVAKWKQPYKGNLWKVIKK